MGAYDDAAAAELSKLEKAAQGWQGQDYVADDELADMLLEFPPFGTERHRFLSTILRLRK